MTGRPNRNGARAEHESVTAAEVIRNFGYWQQRALQAPLSITHHGRSRVVLISSEAYEKLQSKTHTGPVESDAEARRIMEHAIEGFLIYDREVRLIHGNEVARDYFGSQFESMLNMPPGHLSPVPLDPQFLQHMRHVLETRTDISFDTDSVRFPGRKLRVRLFPYGDGVAVLFLNQTEMEYLRGRSAQMNALRRAVQATGRVGVIMLDPREHLLFADHVVAELTGYTQDDLNDMRLVNFILPEDRDRMIDMQRRPPGSREAVNVRVIVKSGEIAWMTVLLVPIGYDFSPIGDLIMFTPCDTPAA